MKLCIRACRARSACATNPARRSGPAGRRSPPPFRAVRCAGDLPRPPSRAARRCCLRSWPGRLGCLLRVSSAPLSTELRRSTSADFTSRAMRSRSGGASDALFHKAMGVQVLLDRVGSLGFLRIPVQGPWRPPLAGARGELSGSPASDRPSGARSSPSRIPRAGYLSRTPYLRGAQHPPRSVTLRCINCFAGIAPTFC